MVYIVYPRSDEKRILLLRKTIERTGSDWGRRYLPTPMVAIVNDNLTRFHNAVHEFSHLLEQRVRKIDIRNEASAELELYLSGFRQGVLWRIRTKHYRPSYMHFFQITPERMSDYLSAEALNEMATHYIVGDRDAVRAGNPPMANPSADDLRLHRATVREAITAATDASEALDRAQHVVDPLREEVDEVIRLVNQQLDVTTHGLNTDDVRAIKRRFGFFYDTDEGAEESATDAGIADDEGATTA